MRFFAALALLLVLPFSGLRMVGVGARGAAAGADGGAIAWDSSLQRAKAASRATNQPVLVEFWATWCAVCKAMDQDVYSDGMVATAMRKVKPVRVDVDQEPSLVSHYAITGTPTLVLMDAFGTELLRVTGALSRDNLLQWLDETPHSIATVNALSAKLAAAPGDFAALTALGRELRAQAFYRASSAVYERALKTKAGQQPAAGRAGILSAMGRNALATHGFAEAARLFDQALKETPGQADPDVLLGLGLAHLGEGHTAEARQALDTVIERHAGTPAATQAAKLRATLPSS